jgi:hypothetical protein
MNTTSTRNQNLETRMLIELAVSSDFELATIDSFQPQADTWVKLRNRPNEYSDDEALLLCETGAGAWLGWVAGCGQIELQPGKFYRLM